MRIVARLLGVAILAGTLSSCVAKKEYEAVVADRERLRSDSTKLRTDLSDCLQQQEGLLEQNKTIVQQYQNERNIWDTEKEVLLTQLDQQGVELDEKNAALRERAERLQELQSRLDDQMAATRALRSAVANALVNFSSDELQVSIENGRVKVSLSENLLFPSASVDLDPKGVEALGKLAVVLKNNPDVDIMIVGYTDSLAIRTARFRNNWDLSVIRATTISSILQEKYGVAGNRLTAAGQAEFVPIATNSSEEGRALNRRTEIYLSPKLDVLMEALDEEEEGSSGEVEDLSGGVPR